MPASIHAVVNDMVCGEDEHGDATLVLPVGDAYRDVAKWASGVDLLLTAVTSTPCAVHGGLLSLRALLIEMMQLSKFDLDADDRASFITTEEYVPDDCADGLPMSDLERDIRVPPNNTHLDRCCPFSHHMYTAHLTCTRLRCRVLQLE